MIKIVLGVGQSLLLVMDSYHISHDVTRDRPRRREAMFEEVCTLQENES